MKTLAAILSGLLLAGALVYSAMHQPKAPGTFSFTYACPPGELRIVAVSPSEVQTGDLITIYGCGFQPGATVTIGGVKVAGEVSEGGRVISTIWTGPKVNFQQVAGK